MAAADRHVVIRRITQTGEPQMVCCCGWSAIVLVPIEGHPLRDQMHKTTTAEWQKLRDRELDSMRFVHLEANKPR